VVLIVLSKMPGAVNSLEEMRKIGRRASNLCISRREVPFPRNLVGRVTGLHVSPAKYS
jgi:hypothetical protein